MKSHHPASRLLGFVCVSICLAGLCVGTARGEEVLQLPPLIVEQKAIGPAWRYARLPGFEILSLCYDEKSGALAFSYYRARRQLTALIPERFLGQFDVPTKLILYDDAFWGAAVHESAAAILPNMRLVLDSTQTRKPGEPTPFDKIRAPDPLLSGPPVYASPKTVEGPTTYSRQPVFFKDMRLSDDDEIVLFTVAPAGNDNYYQRVLRPTYVAQLISARTPQLPPWFVTGFLDLYSRLDFAEDTITLAPFEWIDPEHTKEALHNPRAVSAAWRGLVGQIGRAHV